MRTSRGRHTLYQHEIRSLQNKCLKYTNTAVKIIRSPNAILCGIVSWKYFRQKKGFVFGQYNPLPVAPTVCVLSNRLQKQLTRSWFQVRDGRLAVSRYCSVVCCYLVILRCGPYCKISAHVVLGNLQSIHHSIQHMATPQHLVKHSTPKTKPL